MRWGMTSRPHRIKKTSNMQSKRGDLHHTWLHRETNDKVIFNFYHLKSVSRLLKISLDLNAGKSKRIPKGGYFFLFSEFSCITSDNDTPQAILNKIWVFNVSYVTGFCSAVVITSASHAEGRRFEPCQKYNFRKTLKQENKCFSFTSTKNVTHFRCLFFSSCLFVWRSSLSTNL